MKCKNCDKQFASPLERYDGKIFCPHCKKPCALMLDLNVDDQSDEQFVMGEAFYKKALVTRDAALKNMYEEKARELIFQAAQNGHPKAMLRLGFLYGSGFLVSDSRIGAKLAGDCYRNVWNGKYPDNLAKYAYLKEIAVKHHLELAAASGQDVENLVREMQSAGINMGDVVIPESKSEQEDGRYRLTQALESCRMGARRPIFGVVSILSDEFKQWAADKVKVGGKAIPCIKKFIDLKITLKYCLSDELFAIDSAEAERLAEGESEIPDGEEIFIYFFNTGSCKRKYRQLEKYLAGDGYTDVMSIIYGLGAQMRDVIIREDDIECFKSRFEPIKHAYGELVEHISNKNYIEQINEVK